VIDNSRKTIDRGKTVATFCMGRKETYDYIHDNPTIEFQAIDYTNNPLTNARHENMVTINSALEIDLTGQATAESIGKAFYSGIGTEMLSYLTYLARRHGLLGFAAEVLIENKPMLRVFEKMGFDMKKSVGSGVYELHMTFM